MPNGFGFDALRLWRGLAQVCWSHDRSATCRLEDGAQQNTAQAVKYFTSAALVLWESTIGKSRGAREGDDMSTSDQSASNNPAFRKLSMGELDSIVVLSERPAGHPRSLAETDSRAVTPISPAAQKFHLLILCSLLDNSVTLSNSSIARARPGLMLGKCHIADANQHMAEAHPVISTAVSISDLIDSP